MRVSTGPVRTEIRRQPVRRQAVAAADETSGVDASGFELVEDGRSTAGDGRSVLGAIGAGMSEPTPFEVHESGALLHGTKADLEVGDLLAPGRTSNFHAGRVTNHVYVTATLDAAAWGAELASGEGRARIYIVEPTGALEDDPNVTDKKFPGNPTRSYRTREPVRVVGELVGWVGHSPETQKAMRDRLDELKRTGADVIDD